jgi:hypothetical protein
MWFHDKAFYSEAGLGYWCRVVLKEGYWAFVVVVSDLAVLG